MKLSSYSGHDAICKLNGTDKVTVTSYSFTFPINRNFKDLNIDVICKFQVSGFCPGNYVRESRISKLRLTLVWPVISKNYQQTTLLLVPEAGVNASEFSKDLDHE